MKYLSRLLTIVSAKIFTILFVRGSSASQPIHPLKPSFRHKNKSRALGTRLAYNRSVTTSTCVTTQINMIYVHDWRYVTQLREAAWILKAPQR